MPSSALDPALDITFLGEVKPQSRGYIWGLEIKGNEANVKAFEAWCLAYLKNGFRTVKRRRLAFNWSRYSEGNSVTIHLRIDFRDKGKYALTKLQWL